LLTLAEACMAAASGRFFCAHGEPQHPSGVQPWALLCPE